MFGNCLWFSLKIIVHPSIWSFLSVNLSWLPKCSLNSIVPVMLFCSDFSRFRQGYFWQTRHIREVAHHFYLSNFLWNFHSFRGNYPYRMWISKFFVSFIEFLRLYFHWFCQTLFKLFSKYKNIHKIKFFNIIWKFG